MDSTSHASHEPQPDAEPLREDELDHAHGPAVPSALVHSTLVLGGLTLVALGASLPFAPEFSWRLVQVDRLLAAEGLSHGMLVLAGALFFGMGLVARAVRVTAQGMGAMEAAAKRDDSDFLLVADQLTTDVAQSLSSLLQISAEVATLAEGQRVLLAGHEQAESGDQQNALFRLASSVDRLDAGVEERLDSFTARIEELLRGLDAPGGAAPSPFEPDSTPVNAAAMSAGRTAPQEPQLDPAQVLGQVEETSMEFFESMERIESAPSAKEEPPDAGDGGDGTIRIDFDQ